MPHKPTLLDSSAWTLVRCRRRIHSDATRRRAAAAGAAVGDRTEHHRRAWRATQVRRARLHRALARSGDSGNCEDHRIGPLGRPRLRAGVLPDSARHLRVDPAGALAGRRPVRSLARARRRRSRDRHRSEDRQRHSARGAAVQRAVAAVGIRRGYSGPASNPRFFAHTVADEIHQQQRALRGVARTKLTFSSDRDRERVQGTVENVATSRRSTSPTTTAPISAASR